MSDDPADAGAAPDVFGLEVRVVEVTPELAEQWLARNRGNRRPKPPNVARYARDMRDGRWSLTGQPLIFDSTGALRNGQNRLLACIQADKAFDSLVVSGVAPSSFLNMDTGPARTYGDMITIASEGESANAHALGALAAMVFRWEKKLTIIGGGQTVNPTSGEVLDVVARHPLLPMSIAPAVQASKVAELRPPRIGAYCHYRFALIDRDLADEFFVRISNVEFGLADEALRVLYLTLRRMGERERSHRDAYKVLHYVIKTWRVWRGLDEPVSKLQVSNRLPEIE